MAKKPAPRNRSRKKAASRWPVYAGGISGLFLASFLFGMYVLPQFGSKAKPDSEAMPAVEPVAQDPVSNRVKVTELPRESPRFRRRDSAPKREEKKSDLPSPPAVAATDVPSTPPATSSPPPSPQASPLQPSPTSPSPSMAPPKSEPKVHVEPPTLDVPTLSSQSYRVQAGAFADEENARKMADRLATSGYQPSVTTSKGSGGTMYRVQVGPFTERKEAEDAASELSQQGIPAQVQ